MKRKQQIRENFRNVVFERDEHKCKVCGRSSEKLDAHHITDRTEMPNGGYVKENGISLCSDCHIKAETFFILVKEKFGHIICTSKEKAIEASHRL